LCIALFITDNVSTGASVQTYHLEGGVQKTACTNRMRTDDTTIVITAHQAQLTVACIFPGGLSSLRARVASSARSDRAVMVVLRFRGSRLVPCPVPLRSVVNVHSGVAVSPAKLHRLEAACRSNGPLDDVHLCQDRPSMAGCKCAHSGTVHTGADQRRPDGPHRAAAGMQRRAQLQLALRLQGSALSRPCRSRTPSSCRRR
jgi:hypothetical protein